MNIIDIIDNIKEYYSIDDKTVNIANYYLGIGHQNNHTLQECGIQFGLTKEGARQKIAKFMNLASDAIINKKEIHDNIRDIRDLIKKSTPISGNRLRNILYSEGVISEINHSIHWIIPITNLYGKHNHFIKEKINNEVFISSSSYMISKNIPSHGMKRMKDDRSIEKNKLSIINISRENMDFYIDRGWVVIAEPAKIIKSLIIKDIVSNGTIELHKFIKRSWIGLEEKINLHNITAETKENFVRDVAKVCDGYEEIGDDWFWMRGVGRNRLITNIYKIISTHHKINIKEIMDNILYSTDIEYLPPVDSFKRIFKSNDDIDVSEDRDGTVLINKKIKMEDVLTKTEIIIYHILKKNGEFRYSELIDEASEMGVSSHQLLVKLNSSPIFKKRKRGIYSL